MAQLAGEEELAALIDGVLEQRPAGSRAHADARVPGRGVVANRHLQALEAEILLEALRQGLECDGLIEHDPPAVADVPQRA